MILPFLSAVLAFQSPPPPELYDFDNGIGLITSFGSTHYSHSLSYSVESKKVSLTRVERKDENSPRAESSNTYSFRYKIVAVSQREGGREMYVAGIDNTGVSVIEKLTFPDRPGRWRHSYSGTANPIGTPTLPYSGTTTINGVFRPLPDTWHAPSIDVVLETHTYGWIDSMELDPEGRYLLFSTYIANNVYRLDLTAPGAVPQLICSQATVPELVDLPSLAISDHTTLGRVCVVGYLNTFSARAEGDGTEQVLYLVDADNDGVFETNQLVPLITHADSLIEAVISGNPSTITHHVVPWVQPWASWDP